MNKPRQSNMYPWVDAEISHLHGQCSHQCCYCYVPDTQAGRRGYYNGPLTLSEPSLRWKPKVADRVIFCDHMNDLFAWPVPEAWILQIMEHVHSFSKDRTVLFQSKNSERMVRWLPYINRACLFGQWLVGTTLETNRDLPREQCKAPQPSERCTALWNMDEDMCRQHLFVTIEPVMDFDVDEFFRMIASLTPAFVNIGADSKNHKLPEPSADKVQQLIDLLSVAGIEIREKHNLKRLLK